MVGSVRDPPGRRGGLDGAPTGGIEAPKFSVQMLRTEDEVQLSGLIPENPGEGGLTEASLSEAAAALAQGTELPDMLETADYPAPDTWNEALAFGLEALERLELSKVSVTADRVEVKVGDEVTWHLTNIEMADDATHGFAMPVGDVQLSLEPGEFSTFTFKAERAGVYPYYCTEFCSALHLEMVGYLLVSE